MIRLRRFTQIASLLLLFPALAQAHPGHDGHELTWDFGHLAAHPLATIACIVVLGAGFWAARQLARWAGMIEKDIKSDDPS